MLAMPSFTTANEEQEKYEIINRMIASREKYFRQQLAQKDEVIGMTRNFIKLVFSDPRIIEVLGRRDSLGSLVARADQLLKELGE